MKNTLTSVLVALTATLLFSSCSRIENISVSKRHYRNGFYVDLGSRKQEVKLTETAQNLLPVTPEVKPSKAVITEPALFTKTAEVPNPTPPTGETKKQVNTGRVYASRQPESEDMKVIQQASMKKHIAEVAEAKPFVTENQSDSAPMWVIVLFAIIIPPLGVALKFGIVDKFWISLILTLLFWLPGAIYSLIVVLD